MLRHGNNFQKSGNDKSPREKERENLASKKEIKQQIVMAMKYSAVGFLVAFLSYSIGKLYRETFMIVIKKKSSFLPNQRKG